MRPGFSVPDFSAPLDTDAAIAAVPQFGKSKGTFLSALRGRIQNAGHVPVVPGPFIPFKDYPAADYCRLLVQAAKVVHPGVPVREGLRREGRAAYTDLNASLAGRVLFGALGRDIVAITKLASKAYEMSGHPQRAEVLEAEPHHSLIRLSEIFAFVDCYQVGVFEGVLEVCGLKGSVTIKKLSHNSAEFHSVWA